jgi:hypothetical protein
MGSTTISRILDFSRTTQEDQVDAPIMLQQPQTQGPLEGLAAAEKLSIIALGRMQIKISSSRYPFIRLLRCLSSNIRTRQPSLDRWFHISRRQPLAQLHTARRTPVTLEELALKVGLCLSCIINSKCSTNRFRWKLYIRAREEEEQQEEVLE